MKSRASSRRAGVRRALHAICGLGIASVAVPLVASSAAFGSELPRAGWQEIASEARFRAEATYRDDGIWLRVSSVAPHPLELVCRVLSAVDRYDEWYPGLVGSVAIETRAAGALIYGRFAPPWPFKERDYVAEQRWLWIGETLQLESRGTEAVRHPPREGIVRLRNLFIRWRLTGLGEQTGIEFVYREPGDSYYRSVLVRMLAGFARELISNLERVGPTIAADATTPACSAPPRAASETRLPSPALP